ncbi:acyl dehydratase [Streptomyces sp. NPDC007002]|uniref:acyl dehydratase n=1 Tax=Streptomyces sp. NPDC007002 TaxID=3156910 RepID=UPI00345415B9
MTPPHRVGDELPPLEIPVTRTLIVAGAVASRDFQDVHHDAELAREKGSPDIFMNILTTNGLVGRYLTDHFGPTAVLRKVAIRLGAPNYPGDVLRLTGRITELAGGAPAEEADGAPGGPAGGGPVEFVVQVTGDNGIGRHVTGTVTVALPGRTALPDRTAHPGATALPDRAAHSGETELPGPSPEGAGA